MFFPGLVRLEPQRVEPWVATAARSTRLVREVPVERRARDPEPLPDRPQRHPFDAALLDGADRLLHEGPGQVAVVVAILAFSGHKRMVRLYVDTVNMCGYIDVDTGNINHVARNTERG
jgi:hypothetical protein